MTNDLVMVSTYASGQVLAILFSIHLTKHTFELIQEIDKSNAHTKKGSWKVMEFCFLIRVATCDLQQCDILTSVDSDEPVQPPFKLRNSKLCSVSSLTLIEYSSD